MKRREFITLLGGAAAWPFAAGAQQPDRVRRIGVLQGVAEDDPEMQARLAAFRQGLERLGWSEGRNVRIDYRFTYSSEERAQTLAKELVAAQPDVIFSQSVHVAVALQRETRAIPIVFVGISDPIGSGFVTSLARPGGNFTGILLYEATITGKWLAMLKEVAPRVARAALMLNTKSSSYVHNLPAIEAMAASLKIETVIAPVENVADIERAIKLFVRVPNGGLVLLPDTTIIVHRDLVIGLAARHQLPAVYSTRYFVAAGGLMSYGNDQVDMYLQAASYVDRILRGDKPADLPVQVPTKYELVINLKTAKALGLEIPQTLLARADEVIE